MTNRRRGAGRGRGGSEPKRILVVDDDMHVRMAVVTTVRKQGYKPSSAQSAAEARQLIASNNYDMVITDWRMETRNAGLDVIRAAIAKDHAMPVLVITGFAEVTSAVTALKAGAYDFIEKPFEIEELEATIDAALHRRRPLVSDPQSSDGKNPFEGIIGSDPSIQRIFDLVSLISDTDATTMLTGETGTGKELFARAIHRTSRRHARFFVPVNCGAIPETLFEAELFGYKRGAFTGAVSDRPGRFKVADGGTIFLDEIGDLPMPLQVKLLRVLQEKTIQPVGSPHPEPVNVRVVAATHHDLEKSVEQGTFREDLYYRLNVIQVDIPPLRERPGDILELVRHFVQRFNTSANRQVTNITARAQDALLRYHWPGNIRELENTIERNVILCRGDTIDYDALPSKIRRADERPISRPTRVSSSPPPPHTTPVSVGSHRPDTSRPLDLTPIPEPIRASAPPPGPSTTSITDTSVAISDDTVFVLPKEGIDLKTFVERIESDLIDQALARTNNVVKRAADLLRMNRTTLVERLKKRERRKKN